MNAQTTLFSDNFSVDANVNNPNYEYNNGRQGGTQAPSQYTYSGNVQVGHSYVAFGQPVGDANVMLMAGGGGNAWAYNNLALNDSMLNGSPLSVSFSLYTSYSGNIGSDWLSFAIGGFAPSGNPWPAGGGQSEFSIIDKVDGSLFIQDHGNTVFSEGAGSVTSPDWNVVFSGAGGAGSPFDGTTHVSVYDGVSLVDQFNLTTGLSSGDQIGFNAYNQFVGGVGNLDVMAIPEPTTIALAGLGLGALLISRRRKS